MDKLVALRVFHSIHEAGSFVAAAGRLEMSTAMVSKYVSALEQELGTRLIQRTTRRLAFTEAGLDYARRASLILAQLEEADAAAMQQSVEARGTLRMAAPLSFGMRYLGGWLAELRRRHPQLKVELELSDRQVDLVEDGFDLALRISTQPLGGGMIARPLGRIPLLLCAAPGYLAANGTPQSPQDLAGHSCLRYQQGNHPQSWRFWRDGEESSIEVDGPLQSNNGDVLVNAAIAGMGLLYQPRFLLEDALQRGELLPLLTQYTTRCADVYVVYPARRYLPQKVRVLIELLQDMLAGHSVPAPMASS
ncbi:LysR family transcriptional regulator [Vogesella sp. LIG4]|uniref:LysR family transcriptional regulator n=1 Tax=Vogesella sp. LIG4 TaxID=1192162 RepID=UPI00081FD1CC|nr:LysR family transcriptional regulator [Vogesella sp. LIG4]SCK06891.1 transcriptional regulator, LysR family [Vogesella sp. LIG4]